MEMIMKKFIINKQKDIKEVKKELDDKYVEEMTKLEDLLTQLKQRQEKEMKEWILQNFQIKQMRFWH